MRNLVSSMKSICNLTIWLLLFACLVTNCTTRRAYDAAANVIPVSANAININTATVEELEKLPYIGRKTAESIVEFRAANGPFSRVEHLMQIRGVSEKRFAGISHLLKTE